MLGTSQKKTYFYLITFFNKSTCAHQLLGTKSQYFQGQHTAVGPSNRMNSTPHLKVLFPSIYCDYFTIFVNLQPCLGLTAWATPP